MSERFDIIVVGAGLIGAALALRLAQITNLSIALVERNPASLKSSSSSDSNQRVVALGHVAVEMLRDVGVFEQLGEQHAYPYQAMSVWDENSQGDLCFSAQDAGASELGFMVDAEACTRALQAQALNSPDKNLTCLFETPPTELVLGRDGATLVCLDSDTSSSKKLKARLVIGADGARSWVRKQAKLFANHQGYGQRGIVAKIKTSNSHQDCAWQRFLSTGPVAALPVSENYSSIVWSADNAFSKELMAMTDEQFSLALADAFEQRLGSIVELGARQAFPLVSQQAESYYSTSLALVGDAAHSIHPLAGQGANLGFKDALCLSTMINDATKSDHDKKNNIESIGELAFLHSYQKQRQLDNQQTDWLMTALNSGYKFDMPLWSALRGTGMNWVDSNQTIKTVLAKQAMGLS